MSVDHYLTCEKCKECIHIAQDGLSGYAFYSGEPECMKALGEFLKAHSLCVPEVCVQLEQYVEDYSVWDWRSMPLKVRPPSDIDDPE